MFQSEMINTVLENARPLEHPRGDRLPLYVWSVVGAETGDDAETEEIMRQLDERGIGFISSWNHNNKEQSLAEGLRLDRMEQPPGAFLRPMIAVYHLERVGFTVSVEGRSHLKRKVVRVGRFADELELERGRAFIESLDGQAERVASDRMSRSLFHEEGTY